MEILRDTSSCEAIKNIHSKYFGSWEELKKTYQLKSQNM